LKSAEDVKGTNENYGNSLYPYFAPHILQTTFWALLKHSLIRYTSFNPYIVYNDVENPMITSE